MIYRVRILYRERTYEKRAGAKPEPYRWTYKLQAPSEQQAVDLAVAEFQHIARLSSVGWVREIVAIEVHECRLMLSAEEANVSIGKGRGVFRLGGLPGTLDVIAASQERALQRVLEVCATVGASLLSVAFADGFQVFIDREGINSAVGSIGLV